MAIDTSTITYRREDEIDCTRIVMHWTVLRNQ